MWPRGRAVVIPTDRRTDGRTEGQAGGLMDRLRLSSTWFGSAQLGPVRSDASNFNSWQLSMTNDVVNGVFGTPSQVRSHVGLVLSPLIARNNLPHLAWLCKFSSGSTLATLKWPRVQVGPRARAIARPSRRRPRPTWSRVECRQSAAASRSILHYHAASGKWVRVIECFSASCLGW